jgi:phosphoglycolate phosphatase-like HAD superfamily hydrolase
LFDIDGTLVSMRGAGSRAMGRAFEGLTGIPRAFDGVPMAGRTDRAILATALERLAARGQAAPDLHEFCAPFAERYLAELSGEAAREGPTVCPGVIAALDELERRRVVIGLATGNFAGAARIKLARFGLWSRFAFGGFGDRTCDRVEVVAEAAAEGRRRSGAAPGEVLVIGDTAADVEAGRAVGARTLAVATGPFSVADLEPARPDRLLASLVDAAAARVWDLPGAG